MEWGVSVVFDLSHVDKAYMDIVQMFGLFYDFMFQTSK